MTVCPLLGFELLPCWSVTRHFHRWRPFLQEINRGPSWSAAAAESKATTRRLYFSTTRSFPYSAIYSQLAFITKSIFMRARWRRRRSRERRSGRDEKEGWISLVNQQGTASANDASILYQRRKLRAAAAAAATLTSIFLFLYTHKKCRGTVAEHLINSIIFSSIETKLFFFSLSTQQLMGSRYPLLF